MAMVAPRAMRAIVHKRGDSGGASMRAHRVICGRGASPGGALASRDCVRHSRPMNPSSPPRPGRLFLDVSSLALWSGPAVGIARVEQALYAYARDRLPEVEFSFLDPKSGVFHALSPAWRKIVLGWDGQIDLSTRTPWRRAGLRRLLPSRYRIVMALERRRLTARCWRCGRIRFHSSTGRVSGSRWCRSIWRWDRRSLRAREM